MQGGLYKALLVIAGLVIFFIIIKKMQGVTKFTGILGPFLIFSVYLVFCIFFIESPYIDLSYTRVLDLLRDKKRMIKSKSETKTN